VGLDTNKDCLTDRQSQYDFDLRRIGSWCETVASLREREPGSRGTSTVAFVVRNVKLVANAGTVLEPRGRGTTAVESLYQATASEDFEDIICAVVTVIF
jgi:hypothetical protein